MWWCLCVTEWTPMSLTECPERFERIISAKILTGTEMVQNKKRSLNPWFSTYRKQAKKTYQQNMLPVMKKGRVNQESEAKGSEEGVKSHGEGLQSFQTLESNQGTSSLCLGGPQKGSRLRTRLRLPLSPIFELRCLWQFSYAGPNIIYWVCGARWLVSLVSWITGKQILHSRSCTWVVCGEPHSHQGFRETLEAGRKVWNRASRNNQTCQ